MKPFNSYTFAQGKKKYMSIQSLAHEYSSLLLIANEWKQLKCPSTGEHINKLWYIHTMRYCSAITRNKLVTWQHEWTLSYLCWMKEYTLVWFHWCQTLKKLKLICRDGKKMSGYLGRRKMEWLQRAIRVVTDPLPHVWAPVKWWEHKSGEGTRSSDGRLIADKGLIN